MSDLAIVTEGLGKKLGNLWVLRGFDLHVPQGCVYGLVGRNGSGKSTVMNLLAGLLTPEEGSCLINGHRPEVERRQVATELTYVDQAKTMYGHLTVGQMIGFARGLSPNWSVGLATKYVRIPLHARIRDLSREERVQLSYGLAAARRTPILLIDEPTANLDPITVQEMLRALIQDCVAEGSTVLIASHEMEEMSQVCERIGLLQAGELRHEVTVEDIADDYGVITSIQPPVEVAEIPDILRVRWLNGAVRYLVKSHRNDVAAQLVSRGAKILEIQSVSLRSLYLELLDDCAHSTLKEPVK